MTIQTSKENPYEIDIKKLILKNPNMFDSHGEARVVFEKALPQHKVIADALIFDDLRGVIGIEIKTEHDSTKRLNKQLNAYERLADETWVLIHDSQYDKVRKVLDDNHHDAVGIMCYSAFKGEIILASMREPRISPKFNPRDLLRVLWKKELIILANTLVNTNKLTQDRLKQELHKADLKSVLYNKTGKTVAGGKGNVHTKRMNKEQVIDNIIRRAGLLGAHQIVVDMFVHETKTAEKVIHYYHFAQKGK